MSITERQIHLVQSTFDLVEPISDVASELFYARLFEIEPAMAKMFTSDMREQRRKLMQMLAVAVRGLNHLEKIVPAIEDLGRRHTGYGVRPEHYATVGEALLWTLEQGLGETFTPEVREAWAAVYGLVATTMMKAAYDAVPLSEE
jgi:hemoglobin-like flavoprotein